MKSLPFNLPNAIVEIEIFADSIYYVLYGSHDAMNNFKSIINDYYAKNNIDKKYIVAKLNHPVATLCDSQRESYNKKNKVNHNFNFNKNLEFIQCLVYAECANKEAKDMYTLICLEKIDNTIEFNYPQITLVEDSDPEEVIYKVLKKIDYKIARCVKKNIKLVDIVGDNDEILVYACKLTDNLIKQKLFA